MKRILILMDHCGYTFTSLKRNYLKSIDLEKLKDNLEKKGYKVFISSLHAIDERYKISGTYVFYPSSEVHGLFYKEYIEDILLELDLRGLILLPAYKYFRAHHNKVFMELLRPNLKNINSQTIISYPIYDNRDLMNILEDLESKLKYPMVLKMSSGSGSRGVSLAKNRKDLLGKVKKMTYVKYRNYSMPWYSNVFSSKMKTLLRKICHKAYINRSYPQEKMVIQNFIANLKYDYKVLVFGNKYYVLKRLTRENDFRASGSGKLIFPDQINDADMILLARDVSKQIENELEYPGQIKVNVIRESRVTDYAK